jgi:hypothetical protein
MLDGKPLNAFYLSTVVRLQLIYNYNRKGNSMKKLVFIVIAIFVAGYISLMVQYF